MFDNGDVSSLVAVFDDVVSLFQGRFPGYKACDTPYHNLRHTTDVFLGMARLVHGAQVAGENISEAVVRVGLIAALMHDTGYVRKNSDTLHRGAQLAPIHVRRSVDFMALCLTQNGFLKNQISQTENIILCTEHENASGNMTFSSNNHRLLGNMMASADLLAQTADRTYLEKLPLLYTEFKEAGNGIYKCELDLIKESLIFNDRIHARLVNQLDNVNRFLKNHFQVRWGVDIDLYQLAIKRSMVYIDSTLIPNASHYQSHLRRSIKS